MKPRIVDYAIQHNYDEIKTVNGSYRVPCWLSQKLGFQIARRAGLQ